MKEEEEGKALKVVMQEKERRRKKVEGRDGKKERGNKKTRRQR